MFFAHSFRFFLYQAFAYVFRFLTSGFSIFSASVVSYFAVFVPITYRVRGYTVSYEKYYGLLNL